MTPPKADSKLLVRRRVRKACDECRLGKTKCDGVQPCQHCRISLRECVYSETKRPRFASPVYVKELETKVARLEGVLNAVLPNLNSETLDELESMYLGESYLRQLGTSPLQASEGTDPASSEADDELLETMIDAAGRLSIDDKGNNYYHGQFSGLVLLDGIGERCGQLLRRGPEHGSWASKSLDSYIPSAFDLTWQPTPEPSSTSDKSTVLPPRDLAELLVTTVLDNACCLMTFIHRPTFNELFNLLYTRAEGHYGTIVRKFLPVFYEVLALGELFLADERGLINHEDQYLSLKYFRAGRDLLDVTECRDLMSLQTLILMIMYLQASGRSSASYSYLSIAVASSLQIGIHISEILKNFDPVEQETRKRVFWTLRTMDTYIPTVLGLPNNFTEDCIHQDLPLELDDDLITKGGIRYDLASGTTTMAAVNAHTKLLLIMGKIVKCLYPAGDAERKKNGSYWVKSSRVVELESALDDWFQNLPQVDPSGPTTSNFIRTQLRLRMAYAHVQMVLYRPFLHHIIRLESGGPPNQRSYACASGCVKASMQVIWLTEQLDNRGLLARPYWLTVYMSFFAAMSLLMFALGNPSDPTVPDCLKAAEKVREILSVHPHASFTGLSCVASLTSLFDRIPWLSRFPYDETKQSNGTMAPTTTLGPNHSPTAAETLSPEFLVAQDAFGATITATPEAIAAGMLSGNLAFPLPISAANARMSGNFGGMSIPGLFDESEELESLNMMSASIPGKSGHVDFHQ